MSTDSKTAAQSFTSFLAQTEGLQYKAEKSTGRWVSFHATANNHRVCITGKEVLVFHSTVDVSKADALKYGLTVKDIKNGAIRQEIRGMTQKAFEDLILPALTNSQDAKRAPVVKAKASSTEEIVEPSPLGDGEALDEEMDEANY